MIPIIERVAEEVKTDEAYRCHMYPDSKGVTTIGYGLNLDDGISEPLAAKIVVWILEERLQSLEKLLPFWRQLTPARQEVFLNMAYNLGIPRLLKFRDTLAAAAAGDVEGVCREMEDSLWYREVGERADQLIEKYRRG